MELLTANLPLPALSLEYVIEDKVKKFRFLSSPIDPLLLALFKNGDVHIQIWMERELRKSSGGRIKRSWVHSNDFSSSAPSKLFLPSQYNYGAGKGWGWKTLNILPSYSKNNGFAPTEFALSMNDIFENRFSKKVEVSLIFHNILKCMSARREARTGDPLSSLALLGRNRARSQPIRIRFALLYQNKALFSPPSNPLVLAIRPSAPLLFSSSAVQDFIKVGYSK